MTHTTLSSASCKNEESVTSDSGTMNGRVVVAASPAFPRASEGAILDLGGVLSVFYTAFKSHGDYAPSVIGLAQSHDAGMTWASRGPLVQSPTHALSRVAMCHLPDGGIGMAYTRSLMRTGEANQNEHIDGDHHEVVWRTSNDHGRTWSGERMISCRSHDYELSRWDRVFKLHSGRILTLVQCPGTAAREGQWGMYLLWSDDCGNNWHHGERLIGSFGFWEGSLVEHEPGRLLMYGRTTADRLYASRSEDGGQSWSTPQPTGIAHPIAPPCLTRVPGSKRLLMIRNPDVEPNAGWHHGRRIRLIVEASDDLGTTWEPILELENSRGKTWYMYPSLCWTDDHLHLIYSTGPWELGSDLLYQSLERDWIIRATGASGTNP